MVRRKTDQCSWGHIVSHLIYWQDAIQDHVSFGGDKCRHNQTRAITQHELRIHKESLEKGHERSALIDVCQCKGVRTDSRGEF